MENFYSIVYKGFITASIVAFIVGFFTNSKVSLGAYIAGYSVLILAILMILIILFNNILKLPENSSVLQTITSIFMIAGPFILILAVISFILFMLITYKNKIMDGQVAPSYSSFSNIIFLLLIVQLYIIYSNISNEKFNSTGKLSKVTTSILYLFGILTAITSIVLYIILKYYSTDGFSTIY